MFYKHNPPKRLLIVLVSAICLAQLLIRIILYQVGGLTPFMDGLLDTFILFIIIIPLVSWLVIWPAKKAISELTSANKMIDIQEGQMLSSLNALAKARDNETGNHIIRTQLYVKNLALRLRKMGYYENELSNQTIDLLYKAAPLHDIGKVGIPDDILLKPGRLNDAEWEIMKTHTTIGEAVLSSAENEFNDENGVIAKAKKIAGGHHEKWDGSGYPRGISGVEIPLAARIMSVADVYDALVSQRIYKPAWSHNDAVREIISKRGTHFDPLVVDAFIADQDGLLAIYRQYEDS
jgi:response regulator RpfG family c-di-GMP phosphodiesterase